MATVFHTAVSLDGFLADDQDDFSWVFSLSQEPGGAMGFDEFVANAGAVLMGANTYRLLSAMVSDQGMDWPYSIPAWVFTHHDLTPIEGQDINMVEGDVADRWADVQESSGGKDIWVMGGGDLAAQIADAGLLDEIIVNVAPLTLGSGKPLFTHAYDLRLIETAKNGDFSCSRYEVLSPRS